MAFPWLFPHGGNGYNYPRHTPIPRAMYFRQRLCHKSGIFRKNMTYLLHSAVNVDLSLLKSEININMRMTKSINEDKYVTASDVMNLQHNTTLCQNSYMFMKNIRGTVAYFRNQLYNLLAMFKCIGPPTLFMTLSADDLHWTELGMLLHEVNFKGAQQRKSFTEYMRKDPLMTAIHFERRFDALMKHVILSGPEPLGKVLDYFALGIQNVMTLHQNEKGIKTIVSILQNTTCGCEKVKDHVLYAHQLLLYFTDDYYYSFLFLLIPHRAEVELLQPYENAKDAFVNKRMQMDSSLNFTYFSFVEQIEDAIRKLNMVEELTNAEIANNDDGHIECEVFSYNQMEEMSLNENLTLRNFKKEQMEMCNQADSEHFQFHDEFHLHSLHCIMSYDEFQRCTKELTFSQVKALRHVQGLFSEKQLPFHIYNRWGWCWKNFYDKTFDSLYSIVSGKDF